MLAAQIRAPAVTRAPALRTSGAAPAAGAVAGVAATSVRARLGLVVMVMSVPSVSGGVRCAALRRPSAGRVPGRQGSPPRIASPVCPSRFGTCVPGRRDCGPVTMAGCLSSRARGAGISPSAPGSCSWLAYATLRDPALPGASVAFWAYQRLGSALLLAVPLVLLLYPGGRLPTGKWRIAALISLAATALLPAALLFVPSDVAQAQAGALPAAFATLDLDLTTVPLTAAVWSPLLRFGYAALPLSLLVPLAVVARRYRRSTGQARA